MNRRAAGLAIAALCLLALAAIVWWRSGRSRPATAAAPASTNASPASATASAHVTTWTAQIYFPGGDGRLYGEARDLATEEEPQARLRALVEAVLAGPKDPALSAPLPHGVEVDTVMLAPNGIAYVALRSADQPAPPATGSLQEMGVVYSLVDSVALNLEGVQRVALLWNGNQLESFAGHLDTSRPLAPDKSLLAHPANAATPSAPPATAPPATDPNTPR